MDEPTPAKKPHPLEVHDLAVRYGWPRVIAAVVGFLSLALALALGIDYFHTGLKTRYGDDSFMPAIVFGGVTAAFAFVGAFFKGGAKK